MARSAPLSAAIQRDPEGKGRGGKRHHFPRPVGLGKMRLGPQETADLLRAVRKNRMALWVDTTNGLKWRHFYRVSAVYLFEEGKLTRAKGQGNKIAYIERWVYRSSNKSCSPPKTGLEQFLREQTSS